MKYVLLHFFLQNFSLSIKFLIPMFKVKSVFYFMIAFILAIDLSFGQCPSGASPYSGQTTIQSNEVFCMTADLTVASLTIASGGKLYVSNGKKLTVSGNVVVSGTLQLANEASVSMNKLTIGNGTVSNALVNLGKKAYLKITNSLVQTPSTSPFVSKLEMWSGSVVENCGTHHQGVIDYPFIKYLGSESVKSYYIVKKAVTGAGAGAHFSHDNNIVVIAMHSVSGVTAGLATYCGEYAEPAYCPSWPSGLSNNPNECNNVTTILANLPEPETACSENTFTKSTDPNTIEYDNIVCGFHATILKESNGDTKVWGDEANANGTSSVTAPRLVTPANGYNYTGSPLRVTMGSYAGSSLTSVVHQFALLTTTGLYVWGKPGTLVHSDIKGNSAFGSITINGKNDGLPAGVSPSDVKMLFGSYKTLAIVTYSGHAWVLSFNGSKNGDGSNQDEDNNNKKWHRVKTSNTTNLNNVVAVRGNTNALVALTSDGKVYTWGSKTYANDNNGPSSRTYATEITLPSGLSTKMIGMAPNGNYNSYYVLGTNGQLWAMGNNDVRQLGNFSTSNSNTWVRVKSASNTNMENIAWFSPQEHDNNYAAVNALTSSGKLYSWGSNDGQMIGMGSATSSNPVYMGRGLNNNDVLMAVETGGHTTMIVRQCTFKYGYLGHRVDGSMGDGTDVNTNESEFNFSNTAIINLCGAPTAPITKDLKMCEGLGESVNLQDAFIGSVPAGENLVWQDENGNPVTNFVISEEKTFNAVFTGGVCTNNPTSVVNVSFYQPEDQPMYDLCLVILGKDLSTFNAQCKDGFVDLNWATASEKNLNRFEVERSTDGINWEFATSVAATGDSHYEKLYSARDFTNSQTTYYRLKIVDNDDHYERSYPIATQCKATSMSCSIFPVPVSDVATVIIGAEEAADVNLVVTDMEGRVVYQETVKIQSGTNSFKINVSQMNHGIYFLNTDQKDFTPVKLVVQ